MLIGSILFFGGTVNSHRYATYILTPFLGAFAKLQKATISFVMSVRLSFRPH